MSKIQFSGSLIMNESKYEYAVYNAGVSYNSLSKLLSKIYQHSPIHRISIQISQLNKVCNKYSNVFCEEGILGFVDEIDTVGKENGVNDWSIDNGKENVNLGLFLHNTVSNDINIIIDDFINIDEEEYDNYLEEDGKN